MERTQIFIINLTQGTQLLGSSDARELGRLSKETLSMLIMMELRSCPRSHQDLLRSRLLFTCMIALSTSLKWLRLELPL